MSAALTKAEKSVLDALPDDATGKGNERLRQETGLPPDQYEAARLGLIAKGYAQAWRGPGGSLRRVKGDEQLFIEALPTDGTAVPNARVREKLGSG